MIKETITVLYGGVSKEREISIETAKQVKNTLKKKYKVHVIELSSFQLETVKSLDSRISVITNLSGDHLDRYKGISLSLIHI